MNEDAPIDFEELLSAAVREILRHEDPRQLRAWLQQHLGRFIDPGARDMISPEAASALVPPLARAIWNATPLPGNRFRPAPQPAPGRNDPCPCGSGLKFKRCCASAPQFTELTTEMLWEFVLEELSQEQRAKALALKQVPVSGLVRMAALALDEGDPGRAAGLLEPLFDDQPLASLRSEAYEHALDMLTNAYDDLDADEEKLALLDRVVREAARSPLRAGAWQRLAAIRIDEGDSKGAWDAFGQAQRDQPDAPALAHLEILLLAGEGRTQDIPERARYWVRRLRRQGFEEGDRLIDWLQAAVRDPENTFADLGIRDSDGEGELLRDWLASVRGRRLPRYELLDAEQAQDTEQGQDAEQAPDTAQAPGTEQAPDAAEPPQSEEELLSDRLRAMGVPAEGVAEIVGQLRDDLAGMPFDDDPDGDVAFEAPGDSAVLCAPAALRAVERGWRAAFSGSKPFSVSDLPVEGPSPWEDEQAWCGFLGEYPEAFDSLDILDDLATTVMEHEAHGEKSFDRLMLLPLLERAGAILDAAIAGHDAPRLAWVMPENRPALRAQVRLMTWRLEDGDHAQAMAIAERIIALNPADNHGVRTLLMEGYLVDERNEEALSLAERFPGDMLPDTPYGRALALYRLDRMAEAREALDEALDRLPRVRDYLVRKRVREPASDLMHGVTIGGDEQAWQYRTAMRPVWASTRGALDWLSETVPRKRPR